MVLAICNSIWDLTDFYLFFDAIVQPYADSNLVRITRTLLVVMYLLSHQGRFQWGLPAVEYEEICIA